MNLVDTSEEDSEGPVIPVHTNVKRKRIETRNSVSRAPTGNPAAADDGDAGFAEDGDAADGFTHQKHWITSTRSKTGYKGVMYCNRGPGRFRVKWNGSTHSRHAKLAEACEQYYLLCEGEGCLPTSYDAGSIMDNLNFDGPDDESMLADLDFEAPNFEL